MDSSSNSSRLHSTAHFVTCLLFTIPVPKTLCLSVPQTFSPCPILLLPPTAGLARLTLLALSASTGRQHLPGKESGTWDHQAGTSGSLRFLSSEYPPSQPGPYNGRVHCSPTRLKAFGTRWRASGRVPSSSSPAQGLVQIGKVC